MGVEIERRFLCKDMRKILKTPPAGTRLDIIDQAYLRIDKECTVRVRTVGNVHGTGNSRGYITVKGKGSENQPLVHAEFEYEIPWQDAVDLMKLRIGSVITKSRYSIPIDDVHDLKWEVDVFFGDNKGMVIAEIELPYPDYEFEKPEWLDIEISEPHVLSHYLSNARLAVHPVSQWTQAETKELPVFYKAAIITADIVRVAAEVEAGL